MKPKLRPYVKCARGWYLRVRHHVLVQRGPTTSELRTSLQNRDNSRATTDKMMYKATDSQDLKPKKGR